MKLPTVTAFDERSGSSRSSGLGWLSLVGALTYVLLVAVERLDGNATLWDTGHLFSFFLMFGTACHVLGATYTTGRRYDIVTGVGTVSIATGCLFFAWKWWSLSNSLVLLLVLAFGVFGALYVFVGLVVASGIHRGCRDRWNRRLSMATVGSAVLVVVAVISLVLNGVVPLWN